MAWTDEAYTPITNGSFADGVTGWSEVNTTGDWIARPADGKDADGYCCTLHCETVAGGWHANTYILSPATALPVGSRQKIRCYYKAQNSSNLAKGVIKLYAVIATTGVSLGSVTLTDTTTTGWVMLEVPFTVGSTGSVKAKFEVVTNTTGFAAEYPLLIDQFEFWEAGAEWSADTPPTGDWTVS